MWLQALSSPVQKRPGGRFDVFKKGGEMGVLEVTFTVLIFDARLFVPAYASSWTAPGTFCAILVYIQPK